MNSKIIAHIMAAATVFVWGMTFISSKVLLIDFSPIALLVLRFILGYTALWIIRPRKLSFMGAKQEGLLVLAGICGITLYFLFENIALTYTYASNVGIIIAAVPFLTALVGVLILRDALPSRDFFIGFLLAITGIVIISVNGSANVGLNPIGDLLAVFAALVWAIYSTLLRIIGRYGYDNILITRRIFFYGLIFMIPAAMVMGLEIDYSALLKPENFLNLAFLGIGASAICFVTWGHAVGVLGAVSCTVYLYSSPVVTTVSSALILHEEIGAVTIFGIVLTVAGLVLSSRQQQ